MTEHLRLSPTEIRLALRERGYDPVPVSGATMNVPSAGKRPIMSKWQTRCQDPTMEEVQRWATQFSDSVNTGILCGKLAAFDIDITTDMLATVVEEHVCSRLGSTPLRRVGRAPKVLLCYRLATPIEKIQTAALHFSDDPLEKPTRLEVLGRGQQFVGFGTHPETLQPYRWLDASPLTIGLMELPEITEDLLRQVVGEVEQLIRRNGGVTPSERKQEQTRDTKGWRDSGYRSGDKPDRETVADALRSITNHVDYDGWVRIGFALYAALGESGRDLWEQWSATSARNDTALTARKWSSFAEGRSISVGTLFYYAKQAGWRQQGRSGAPKQDRAERRASADPEVEPDDEDGRPIVRFIAGKVPEGVDRMEAILMRSGVEIFSRAGALVRPVIDTVPAAKGRTAVVARMCPLNNVSLADLASRIMRFERFDGRAQDWLSINPPVEMTSTLLAREGQWRIPAVVGIITTPTLRLDGSILDRPGYDPATRLYYTADPSFVLPGIPEQPGKIEALRALAMIEELLAGFPFVGAVDRSVALSGILTALVRGVIPTAPLHAIRAHTPGTGKSYLVDLASVIATGRRCPVIAAGKTEEETEKRLGALLRDAVPIVSIDNVNAELGGDALCQMTERPLIRVRILGKSEAPELECRAAVFATGNNLTLVGDMTRRALICSLDAGVERPELRSFDLDPLAEVMADRGRIVAAALTVIRAYRAAGSPTVCGPLGSYEAWTEMVRAPLIWLGQTDPAASMETAREEDPELSAIRELFQHWREHLFTSIGYTANAIIKTACEKGPGSSYDYNVQEFRRPEFRDLLLRVAGDGGAVSSRRLGKWLSMKVRGRVVDGHRLEVREDGSNGNRFTLCEAEPAWSAPFSET